jgi:hypothetical protein
VKDEEEVQVAQRRNHITCSLPDCMLAAAGSAEMVGEGQDMIIRIALVEAAVSVRPVVTESRT